MTRIEAAQAAGRAGGLQVRQTRVLVVEDNRDSARTLTLMLKGELYEVANAYTGLEALSAVAEFDPDAVLLDIALPGLSGWEVARQIRERHNRGRPFIIGLSGEYTQGSDNVLAQILGFNHYLVKPYDPRRVLELLKSVQSS